MVLGKKLMGDESSTPQLGSGQPHSAERGEPSSWAETHPCAI